MSKTVTIVDNLAIAYSQLGKGKDVLLLHGWGDDHRTFDHLAKQLSADYRVTALDLPGFGGSEPPKTAWDLSNYALLLGQFCDKLALKPYAVIGHSNGGALAIHALASRKLQAERLVLLAASGVRTAKGLKRTALKVVAKTGKLATFWLPPRYRRRLQMALYGTVGSDMLVVPELQETFKKTVRQDVQADAEKLTLPTLLIYGSNDRATPIHEVGYRLVHRIDGAKIVSIEHAGHFVHHDASNQVEKLITEFIG